MVANRRNLVFRVSIVINIAVILYVAVHLSGTGAPGAEWVPLTVDGSERGAEFRYFKEELRNETEMRDERPSEAYRPSGTAEVATSQKTQPTAASTNKTASSTVSLAELEKRIPGVPELEPDAFNESYEEVDENYLSEGTLNRLRQLLGCHERDFEPQTMQRGDFWVLKNYVRADHGPVQCHETVTYTTHAGFEFLDNVQPLVERWLAPVSLAIHAPGTDYVATVNSIRYLRDCLGTDLVRQFVTFHLFFSSKHIPNQIMDSKVFLNTPYNCTDKPPYTTNASTTYMHQKNLLYPVNVARNVARDSALTHYILPSDIELYPSPNLVPRFLNMIARNGKPLNSSTKPRVFPISIFEVDAKSKVPTTKVELQMMLKNKTAIPFHKHVCPHCHNIPQAQQWMTSNDSKQMEVFHVGKRHGPFVHWEPIFIGTHHDPYYDERLSWDGKKDKMTQGYILCVKDFDFMILNNAFLTHKPGIKHYTRNSKRDEIARKQNAYVKKYIMPELKKLYGVKGGCAI